MDNKEIRNRKLLRVVSKLCDVQIPYSFPNDNYEELNERFQSLKSDFLYNLKVLAKKEESFSESQQIIQTLRKELKRKDNELLSIREEYEDLKKIQIEICEEYSDLRRKFIRASDATTGDSYEEPRNHSHQNCTSINGFTSQTKILTDLQKKILKLDEQLVTTTTDNKDLHNQVAELHKQIGVSKHFYEREVSDLKYNLHDVTQKYQELLISSHKLKADVSQKNQYINFIQAFISQSRTTLKLKENIYSNKYSNENDISQLIKVFVQDVYSKMCEFEKQNLVLQKNLIMKENIEEKYHAENKDKIKIEEEVVKLRKQNTVLIQVIKELKNVNQINQETKTSNYFSNSPKTMFESSTNNKDQGVSYSSFAYLPVAFDHQNTNNTKDFPLNSSSTIYEKDRQILQENNLEEKFKKLKNKIDSLLQNTDEQENDRVKYLEQNLQNLKDHMLSQLQKKMFEIRNSNSNSKETLNTAIKLPLPSENSAISSIKSNTDLREDQLVNMLKDIKTRLETLQDPLNDNETFEISDPIIPTQNKTRSTLRNENKNNITQNPPKGQITKNIRTK